MFKIKAPFKLVIAHLFVDDVARSAAQVFTELQDEYRGESILSLANVESSLQALKSVGIVEIVDNLSTVCHYQLTAHGRAKVKSSL